MCLCVVLPCTSLGLTFTPDLWSSCQGSARAPNTSRIPRCSSERLHAAAPCRHVGARDQVACGCLRLMCMTNTRLCCRSAASNAHDTCEVSDDMAPSCTLAAFVRRGLCGTIVSLHARCRLIDSVSVISIPFVPKGADHPCVSPQHVQKKTPTLLPATSASSYPQEGTSILILSQVHLFVAGRALICSTVAPRRCCNRQKVGTDDVTGDSCLCTSRPSAISVVPVMSGSARTKIARTIPRRHGHATPHHGQVPLCVEMRGGLGEWMCTTAQ